MGLDRSADYGLRWPLQQPRTTGLGRVEDSEYSLTEPCGRRAGTLDGKAGALALKRKYYRDRLALGRMPSVAAARRFLARNIHMPGRGNTSLIS